MYVYAGYNQEYLVSINCIFTVICSAECFVRVRSGQSLDHSVVKDRLNVHSVGECELECLRSRYFTCRVFSYRYFCAYMRLKFL
jgi:PAN domain.